MPNHGIDVGPEATALLALTDPGQARARVHGLWWLRSWLQPHCCCC